jgi:hypothetical protein
LRTALSIAPGVCALPLLASCAEVLGIEETTFAPQEENDDDRAEDDDVADDDTAVMEAGPPPEPGEDYRCLGTDWLGEAESDRIEIIARIIEIESASSPSPTPVAGMTVRVCRSRLDISCTGGTEVVSNAEGLARVEVDRGFNGYLRIEGPDAAGVERVGYLWYFSQPLVNTYVFPILAMTPEFRQDVIYGRVLGSNIEWNVERGEIAINVTDCSAASPPTQEVDGVEVANAPGLNAPGVHLTIDDEDASDDATRPFYFSDGNPVWPRRVQDQMTDASGLGGFLNVPPGPIPITAFPESLDGPSGSDTLLVRANFLTTVRLLPE